MATEPGRTVKCTCPSSSTATTRTTAWPYRLPAGSMAPGRTSDVVGGIVRRRPTQAVVVLNIEVGHQVDFELHGTSLRDAATAHGRVLHDAMLTRAQPVDAILEVVEADVEVTWIAPGRLQPRPAARMAPAVIKVSASKRTSGACWAMSSSVASRSAKTETPNVP